MTRTTDESDFGSILDRMAQATSDREKQVAAECLMGRTIPASDIVTLTRILDVRPDAPERAADLLIFVQCRHPDLICIAAKSQESAARVVTGCPDIRDRRLDLAATGIGSKAE